MKPVLVLGEEPRIVVNIARSLHRRGVIVDVGTLSSDAPLIAISRHSAVPLVAGSPARCRLQSCRPHTSH